LLPKSNRSKKELFVSIAGSSFILGQFSALCLGDGICSQTPRMKAVRPMQNVYVREWRKKNKKLYLVWILCIFAISDIVKIDRL
jgi:hypothetical protein